MGGLRKHPGVQEALENASRLKMAEDARPTKARRVAAYGGAFLLCVAAFLVIHWWAHAVFTWLSLVALSAVAANLALSWRSPMNGFLAWGYGLLAVKMAFTTWLGAMAVTIVLKLTGVHLPDVDEGYLLWPLYLLGPPDQDAAFWPLPSFAGGVPFFQYMIRE
jgi:hypothetical protein